MSIAKDKGIKSAVQIADNMGKNHTTVLAAIGGNPTLKTIKEIFKDGLCEDIVIITKNGNKYQL